MRSVQGSKRKSPKHSLSVMRGRKFKGGQEKYASAFAIAREMADFWIIGGYWTNSVTVNDEHRNILRVIKGYGKYGGYL